MAGDRRRTLLAALAAVVVLSGAAVAVFRELERLAAARSRVGLLEKQIAMLGASLPAEATLLGRREELASAVDAERSRFYAAGEMSPYAFGALVKERLASLDLEVSRYQVVESKGRTALEFAASGSAASMTTFLRDVFASGRNLSVPSLVVRTRGGTGTVDVVFQIGYETLDGRSP